MNRIEIQCCSDQPGQPEPSQIQYWIDAALADYAEDTEIVVRIVDENESTQLNKQYRLKEGPTNILSFPADLPDGIDLPLLGDLVICAPILASEAKAQQKPLHHHWAHIIIHGVLHLLGYDHSEEEEADQMEQKEITILQKLKIDNPYQEVTQQ